MGLVYVFNASAQAIRLSINNAGLGTPINPPPLPPSQMPPPKGTYPYTPYSNQVARSDTPAPLAFTNGADNTVAVQNRGGQSDPATVAVPAAPVSTGDLWLYAFSDLLVLFESNGNPLAEVPLTWDSSAATAPRGTDMSP